MASRLIRLFGVFAMLACAPLAQEHAGPHWSYRGADGPNHWGELDKGFATCQLGHQQSPIDIRAPKAADLPPIQVGTAPRRSISSTTDIRFRSITSPAARSRSAAGATS